MGFIQRTLLGLMASLCFVSLHIESHYFLNKCMKVLCQRYLKLTQQKKLRSNLRRYGNNIKKIKPLEGSANASSFAAMKEIALEQAKTAQKAK